MVVRFNFKIHRAQVIHRTIKRFEKSFLISCKDKFNIELKNGFALLAKDAEDIEEEYKNIKNTIRYASLKIKTKKRKHFKLRDRTLNLIEERQTATFGSQTFRETDKKVKRSIRDDVRHYNDRLVQIALETNKSFKIAKSGIQKGRPSIMKMKDSSGVIRCEKDQVLSICTHFYKQLYSANNVNAALNAFQETTSTYLHTTNVPQITGYEVHCALRSMKYSKSPGEDGISTEALRIGESELLPQVTNLFNSILHAGAVPKNFCHSLVILLHKKGDKTDINNYRPISLVSHLYKAFVKVIENRISQQLDSYQPPEQAGFRRGLSTTDHLHALNQLIEKCTEFKTPLYLAFVDYAKAFDSINHDSLFNALANQNIEPTYINLLKTIYSNSTASIKINTTGPSFPIKRGVKQGDPLSPKLFTATLEEAFLTLAQNWADKGLVIGEKRLSNLRFADDIVLFSSSAAELGNMLEDLNKASLEIGLRMNMSKTKLMTNSIKRRLYIGGEEIAYVQDYIYLGQIVSFHARQDKEVARRTENAWRSYWSMKDLLKGDLPMCHKRRIMDMCILPILTYGAQTWSLTLQQRSKLEVCQRAMERSILGVRISDRIRNTILRAKTKITDVTQKAAKLKWDWAGHVCRMSDDNWAKRTTDWVPLNARRHRGRPKRRWRDELDSYRKDWPALTKDRIVWKREREAFALQWDSTG